jgi:hypothetical protein
VSHAVHCSLCIDVRWSLPSVLTPHCQLLLLTHRQEFAEGLEQFRQLAGAFSQMQVPTALLKCVHIACGQPRQQLCACKQNCTHKALRP